MNGMKRWLPVVSLAVFLLVPLAAHADVVAWTIGIGGWTMTGSEQPLEAQAISTALSNYGYNSGFTGSSNYRNSVYRFSAGGAGAFTLFDGVNLVNLGSKITIIHEQDWIGVATNLCSYATFGSESSWPPDLSDCTGLITWGRDSQTLGISAPPCTVSNSCNSQSNSGVLVNGVCSAVSSNVVDTRTLTPLDPDGTHHFLGTRDDFKWNDAGTVFSANKVCSLAGLPQMATGRVLCAPDLNTYNYNVFTGFYDYNNNPILEDTIDYYARSRHNGDWYSNQSYGRGQGWCEATGIAWVECGSPTAVSAPSDSSCPAPVASVDGQCDNSAKVYCYAGTRQNVNYTNNTWDCVGSGTGTTDHCTLTPTPGCTATTISNCSLSATDSGGSSGSCTSGGTCKYTCDNGTWTENSNSCTVLPDLIAGLVSPTVATVNVPTDLSALITNQGSASTGKGFTDSFQINHTFIPANFTSLKTNGDISTFTSSALAAGEYNTATVSYTFPSTGTWYVRACADKNASNTGSIPESDEDNNCSSGGSNNGWTAITVSDLSSGCTTGGPPCCAP